MELRICQSLFDRQSEAMRRVVEGISNTHTSHMRSLTDFVEVQACYFDQCSQHSQELQKQLASIPAVLCSNNWQSKISNVGNGPSTSNHVANEPTGLNHVTPVPIEVHQVPDFNQDSWTVNSTPTAEAATKDFSVTTQPPDSTNMNNNNNNNGQTSSQFATANQACDHAETSDSQSMPRDQIPDPPQTNEAAGTNSGATNGATNGASALHQTDGSPLSELSSSEITTAEVSESITTNGMAVESETTNGSTTQLPVSNGEDVQEE